MFNFFPLYQFRVKDKWYAVIFHATKPIPYVDVMAQLRGDMSSEEISVMFNVIMKASIENIMLVVIVLSSLLDDKLIFFVTFHFTVKCHSHQRHDITGAEFCCRLFSASRPTRTTK